MTKGRTFIICGPSGVGKGTLIAKLMEWDPTIYFSVSATTRDPRPGEVDGVHYHFLTRERFMEMLEQDAFLEHDEHFGTLYGTPKRYVDEAMAQGRDALLDIDVNGSEQVKAKRPDAVRIFIAPPNMEELEKRLVGRGTEDARTIQGRLARAGEEMSRAGQFDYLIVNDKAGEAAEKLRAILLAEHCRPGAAF